jgi:hypothetical protein
MNTNDIDTEPEDIYDPDPAAFTGHNQLTAMLRERVNNYDPRGLPPSLNNVEWAAAVRALGRYHGEFVYIHARTGQDYVLFAVRAGGENYYLFRITNDNLPNGWKALVPSV